MTTFIALIFLISHLAGAADCLAPLREATKLNARGLARPSLTAYFEALACNPNVIEAQFTGELVPFAPPPSLAKVRAWRRGDVTKGKAILIYAVKGNGDSLQFIRFISLVKAAEFKRVVVAVPPSLVELFGHSFRDEPRIEFVPIAELPRIADQFELQTTIVSLPHLLKVQDIDRRPYLTPPPGRAVGGAIDPGKFNVGVVFSGDATHPHDRDRAFAPADLRHLGELTGVKIYSLQMGSEDLARRFREILRLDTSLLAEIKDYADTATIIRKLDLIVSADTSVSHLAAALGVTTLVPLSKRTDLRYAGASSDNAWYRDMILLRQSSQGDWGVPMAAVRNEVADRAARKTRVPHE